MALVCTSVKSRTIVGKRQISGQGGGIAPDFHMSESPGRIARAGTAVHPHRQTRNRPRASVYTNFPNFPCVIGPAPAEMEGRWSIVRWCGTTAPTGARSGFHAGSDSHPPRTGVVRIHGMSRDPPLLPARR